MPEDDEDDDDWGAVGKASRFASLFLTTDTDN